MISSAEAFLLLNKWHQGKRPLRLMFAAEGIRLGIDGLLADIQDNHLVLFLPHDPNPSKAEVAMDLANCVFAYRDSPEAHLDSLAKLKASSILTATRPDGSRLMFGELNA